MKKKSLSLFVFKTHIPTEASWWFSEVSYSSVQKPIGSLNPSPASFHGTVSMEKASDFLRKLGAYLTDLLPGMPQNLLETCVKSIQISLCGEDVDCLM